MRVEDLMCESRCKEPWVFSYCSFSMLNICILVFYCPAKAFMLDFMATAITFKFQHGSTDWDTGFIFIIPLYWPRLSHTSDDVTASGQIIQRRFLTAISKSLCLVPLCWPLIRTLVSTVHRPHHGRRCLERQDLIAFQTINESTWLTDNGPA